MSARLQDFLLTRIGRRNRIPRNYSWLTGVAIVTCIFATAFCCTPFLTVAELLGSIKDYNRKVIVVAGWLHSGPEVLTLSGTLEPGQSQWQHIWLEDIKYIKANEARWPETKTDRSTAEPASDADGLLRYRKLFSTKWTKPTFIVLKGEFQSVGREQFGHLNGFQHRLIVYEVVSVEQR